MKREMGYSEASRPRWVGVHAKGRSGSLRTEAHWPSSLLGDLLSRSNAYYSWNPASKAWARAAALREGRGPAQARQGLPTRLLFLFDPFKNYSLQIPGQLGKEKPGGRRTEKAAAAQCWDSPAQRAEIGPAEAAGPRRAPGASPGSVSLRPGSWEHRPRRLPGTPSSGALAMGGR